MRLASFDIGGRLGYGLVDGADIFDLSATSNDKLPTLLDFIKNGDVDTAQKLRRGGLEKYLLTDVRLLPPVIKPEKIWCIGVNYPNRNEEYKDGQEPPKYPSLFCRSPASLVGHDTPLERPQVSVQLDYEGEIALVIGKAGRHIPRERALDHVFGATLANEGTVRDWLYHGKFNVTQGKNFDRSGSLGPWIVTADELDLSQPLNLTTRVNGELRQSDTTGRLIFGFEFLISYLSTFATLQPGDVIMTGTPTGAGVRMNPPCWLRPGDVVEVEVAEIGILRNGVVDEKC